MRPDKWDVSQVGFRGSNASSGRIVFLLGAARANPISRLQLALLLLAGFLHAIVRTVCVGLDFPMEAPQTRDKRSTCFLLLLNHPLLAPSNNHLHKPHMLEIAGKKLGLQMP